MQRYSHRLPLLLSLLVVLLSPQLTVWPAGPAALVKDINPTPYQPGFAAYGGLMDVNGTLFFRGWDDLDGVELWRSDGSVPGTRLVKDIFPGASDSYPAGLTNLNGTLFFFADDGSSGAELWRSDGTAAGTAIVRDIHPGAAGSLPPGWTVEPARVHGKLFFAADDGIHGVELWQSDGTWNGTTLVKDLVPGPNSSSPTNLTDVNGTLFFKTNDWATGDTLWRSDGTAAGTLPVKTTPPGPFNDSVMNGLTNVNGTLFFIAWTGSGVGLWKSDGTTAGTIALPGPNSYPENLTNVNGTLFFNDTDPNGVALWKSDGTAAGTVRIKTINPDPSGPPLSNFTVLNGKLYFTTGVYSIGYTLWRSDGTAAGTVPVKSFAPNPIVDPYDDGPLQFTKIGATMFFRTGSPQNGYTLWKSDGTPAGTVPIKTLGSFSYFGDLAAADGRLFFNTGDNTDITHVGLWTSDGTAAGTQPIKPGTPPQGSSAPAQLTGVNGTLFFSVSDPSSGAELWKSDGTTAGTQRVKDINPGAASSDPAWLTNVNGTLFFSANDGVSGAELWKSDGTTAGTQRVKDINPGAAGSDPAWLTNVNGTLFFRAYTDAGVELWRSDGTAAGTQLIESSSPGPGSSVPADLTNVNGTLFFSTWGAGNTRELWRSDPATRQTVRVKSFGVVECTIGRCDPDSVDQLTNVNGTLFFAARESGKVNSLWRSDGTTAGTLQLTDPVAIAPSELTAVGRTLFFVRDDGRSGAELWKSDGSRAGTTLVRDILPGPNGSTPAELTALNGKLFFVANDGSSGKELWRSDGTASGTVQVADSLPGFGSSEPAGLTAVDGALLFSAWDSRAGVELWTSDGTPAGTRRLQDIAPGSASSNPQQFTVAGPRVFFTANDGVAGRELWALPLATLRPVTTASIPSGGGQLVSWIDNTSYDFPAGVFPVGATVTHTVRALNSLPNTGSLVATTHAFEVTASNAGGQAIQPSRTYTITIRYTDVERGPAIAGTLALCYWNGGQWVKEPTSVVDTATNTLTATPAHFSLWAVLGETRRTFLPLSTR